MTKVSANIIDHTLLAPEATSEDVKELIEEAVELGTYSVCVSPSMLPISTPKSLKVAAVCGCHGGRLYRYGQCVNIFKRYTA